MNIGWRRGREKARCNILSATAMKLEMNQANKQAEWGRKKERKEGRKESWKEGD